jgi:disulfide bond formation protein DsbB
MAVITLSFFGMMSERGKISLPPNLNRPLLSLLILLLFIDSSIAGFHAGVEYGWWQGLTSCTSPVDMTGTVEEVLEQIKNAPLIRCDTPAWTMFGISMAGYNFFAAIAIASFGLFSLKKKVK